MAHVPVIIKCIYTLIKTEEAAVYSPGLLVTIVPSNTRPASRTKERRNTPPNACPQACVDRRLAAQPNAMRCLLLT
jgi:hypothetical protein